MLRDALQLPPDAKGGTFELLAGDPEALARLFALAAKQRRQAQVTVTVDGRLLRSFSLSEFLAYNRQLGETPPDVRQPLAEVRSFAAGVLETSPRGSGRSLSKGYDPVCLANCDQNRDWCYQTEPSCAEVDWCDECEDQWRVCSDHCWICTDPKSVTERTNSWIRNAYWRGRSCLENIWNELYDYDRYDLVIQNDRIRRTEYCDGRVVETVLYSWDSYGSCIRNTFWTCPFREGFDSGWLCPF